jgi:hypothetical protein
VDLAVTAVGGQKVDAVRAGTGEAFPAHVPAGRLKLAGDVVLGPVHGGHREPAAARLVEAFDVPAQASRLDPGPDLVQPRRDARRQRAEPGLRRQHHRASPTPASTMDSLAR